MGVNMSMRGLGVHAAAFDNQVEGGVQR